ncbi:MAG TPA: aminoacyl-tRNA hydrolase [Nitrospiraceae bacterium]|nr:aminoacyl-tRNA hydrolase [Nitrospiraceae bacterium]
MIVGLGNPGERYAATRHNIGARVMERAAAQWSVALKPAGTACRGIRRLGQTDVVLAVPLAWMNESGPAVKILCEELSFPSGELIVVHDDLDLPLGRLRIKRDGGAGGHNGILSIIAALETDSFCRLKLGIGRPAPGIDPADYVLSAFLPDEIPVVLQMLDQAVLALDSLITEGIDATMNRFNKELLADSE